MPEAHRVLWEFSDKGHRHREDGTEEGRWLIDKDGAMDDLEWTVFRSPGRVTNWDPEFALECRSRGPLEDMPWAGGSRPVVSERLRAALETIAPGHAQYLPVRLTWKRKPLQLPPYWVANWLHEVECHDPGKTDWLPETDDDGKPMIGMAVIDSARVPERIKICLVRHARFLTIVRGDVKSAIEAGDFKGPQFVHVWLSSDAWPPKADEA